MSQGFFEPITLPITQSYITLCNFHKSTQYENFLKNDVNTCILFEPLEVATIVDKIELWILEGEGE